MLLQNIRKDLCPRDRLCNIQNGPQNLIENPQNLEDILKNLHKFPKELSLRFEVLIAHHHAWPSTPVFSASSLSGCVDGMVGLAARVALVQVPWLILEEEPSPDLTNHITGLETMLGEMQTKVSF